MDVDLGHTYQSNTMIYQDSEMIRGSNRDGSEMIRFDMIHLITISLC